MKTITKSVIKLSELPKHLQSSEIFNSYKIHTYAEFHIDDSEKDDLSLWLIEKYPTIKMKVSFLIHIDIEKQQQGYSEEEVELIIIEMVNWTLDNVGNSSVQSGKKFDEVISKFKNK